MYIHKCAKTQVKFAEKYFCTEEVPVEVTNSGSELRIRFMDPISGVIYRNYTLTLCNKVYPNAFELGNGSLVSNAKQLKLIRTPKRIRETGKKYAILSSFDISDGSLFADKNLTDSQLSKLMKHSRKTKTGMEVFLGQNG